MAASPPTRQGGFTLIELLVAIGIMALMAGLTWRGLDGMTRAQDQVQLRADSLLALQAGLAQWSADLDAVEQVPGFDSIDWDGRALRLTRQTAANRGSGFVVVAWARRDIAGTGQWIRWQSPPVSTREQVQAAWARAAQWGQNPGDADKRFEVVVTPLQEWKIFYFRGDAWSNPLSSAGATVAGAGLAAAIEAQTPDGVRLVLTLPPGQAIHGTLTRDWLRPGVEGGK